MSVFYRMGDGYLADGNCSITGEQGVWENPGELFLDNTRQLKRT